MFNRQKNKQTHQQRVNQMLQAIKQQQQLDKYNQAKKRQQVMNAPGQVAGTIDKVQNIGPTLNQAGDMLSKSNNATMQNLGSNLSNLGNNMNGVTNNQTLSNIGNTAGKISQGANVIGGAMNTYNSAQKGDYLGAGINAADTAYKGYQLGSKMLADKAAEKVADKGTNILAQRGIQTLADKGVEKGAEKVAEKGVQKVSEKGAQKVGEKVAAKLAEKAATKLAEKGAQAGATAGAQAVGAAAGPPGWVIAAIIHAAQAVKGALVDSRKEVAGNLANDAMEKSSNKAKANYAETKAKFGNDATDVVNGNYQSDLDNTNTAQDYASLQKKDSELDKSADVMNRQAEYVGDIKSTEEDEQMKNAIGSKIGLGSDANKVLSADQKALKLVQKLNPVYQVMHMVDRAKADALENAIEEGNRSSRISQESLNNAKGEFRDASNQDISNMVQGNQLDQQVANEQQPNLDENNALGINTPTDTQTPQNDMSGNTQNTNLISNILGNVRGTETGGAANANDTSNDVAQRITDNVMPSGNGYVGNLPDLNNVQPQAQPVQTEQPVQQPETTASNGMPTTREGFDNSLRDAGWDDDTINAALEGKNLGNKDMDAYIKAYNQTAQQGEQLGEGQSNYGVATGGGNDITQNPQHPVAQNILTNLKRGLTDAYNGYVDNSTHGFKDGDIYQMINKNQEVTPGETKDGALTGGASTAVDNPKSIMQRIGEAVGTAQRVASNPAVQGLASYALNRYNGSDQLDSVTNALNWAANKAKSDYYQQKINPGSAPTIMGNYSADDYNAYTNNGYKDTMANNAQLRTKAQLDKTNPTMENYANSMLSLGKENGGWDLDEYNAYINSDNYVPDNRINLQAMKNGNTAFYNTGKLKNDTEKTKSTVEKNKETTKQGWAKVGIAGQNASNNTKRTNAYVAKVSNDIKNKGNGGSKSSDAEFDYGKSGGTSKGGTITSKQAASILEGRGYKYINGKWVKKK